MLAALFYFIVTATNEHVRESGFPYRYAIPPMVLLVTAAAMFAALPARRLSTAWRAGLGATLLPGLLVGIAWRYGAPSYARVHALIDQRFGAATGAIVDRHCTHVLGDYWDVWGAVFHANLTLYEAGSGKVVWGITDRSLPTRDRWLPLLRRGRVAVVRTQNSERDWQRQAAAYQLPPLRLVVEMPEIRVYEP